jgi:hypothetical protein
VAGVAARCDIIAAETQMQSSPAPEIAAGVRARMFQGKRVRQPVLAGRSDRSEAPDRLKLPPPAYAWLLILTLSVLAVYVLFFVVFFGRSGPNDSDQYLVFHRLQYWNAELFGLAKQWTPLMCSGLSMAGEPQIPFMSLSMALSYKAGPLWGVKAALAIYLGLGWMGAFLYSGLWLRIPLQRSLAASLFVGNGFFVCRYGFGHFDFVPFLILPFMLWTLHQAIGWSAKPLSFDRQATLLLATLVAGAAVALVIDGSPVSIIHLMLWIGLYAITLSIAARNATPAVLFACALIFAGFLDAGYLWPMLQAQASFPRLTADSFTSVLSLLWFATLPVRGKVFPANGLGHELSVFIGPVLATCLWRNRHWLSRHLPGAMRTPLLVVSVASVLLGMGSLKLVHIPGWLSPFDLLRSLPGFRSIDVTGRYWGFLALPLSLLSAAALWKTAAQLQEGWRLHVCLGLALLFQLAFQCGTLSAHWMHSAAYREVPSQAYFVHGPEAIDYVTVADEHLQGEVISPTRGVCNCYDMDDFTRAKTEPGPDLVLQVLNNGRPVPHPMHIRADFSSWSGIRLIAGCESGGAAGCAIPRWGRIQIILKQAYHRNWRAPGCETQATPTGNLLLDCPAGRLLEMPAELIFRDPLSDRAAWVSTLSWKICLSMTVGLSFLAGCTATARARRPAAA